MKKRESYGISSTHPHMSQLFLWPDSTLQGFPSDNTVRILLILGEIFRLREKLLVDGKYKSRLISCELGWN